MKSLVSIIGPTATGKTKLALLLAEKFSQNFACIDVISADSRQVYKGMEIGTGVDMPPDFKREVGENFFQKGNERMHGVSFLRPDEEWSVTHFQKFAREVIENSWAQNGLPMLVGGTGLYHRHLFNDDPQLEIKPNEEVRKKAVTMSIAELQNWLQKVDATKWELMNNSDRQNPRRLVRAIEVALSEKPRDEQKSQPPFTHIEIGLTDSIEHISEKIRQRVEERLQNGVLAEVEKLIADYPPEVWKGPAFSATGYKEIRQFLEGTLSREEMIELWTRREIQYAKRQLTWWKKDFKGQWFDVAEKDWMNTVYSMCTKI